MWQDIVLVFCSFKLSRVTFEGILKDKVKTKFADPNCRRNDIFFDRVMASLDLIAVSVYTSVSDFILHSDTATCVNCS